MIKRILVSIIAMGAILASSAYAADLKIGVIDLRQILESSSQVKQLNNDLRKQFKPRQDALLSQQNQLKSEMDKYSRDSAVMSKGDQTKLQQKILQDRQSFTDKEQAFQKDLQQAQQAAMQTFFTHLKEVVKTVAESGHYTLILQNTAAPYAANDIDITSQVSKQLG